jgi:NAD(P)-dependent dehydrogenase (short-subunit alcohol dehydrogenase family)
MILEELFSLKGKVALVTGANSGIGKAIALALAEAGAKLVLVARRQAELDAARQEIEAKGGAAGTIACDLVDRKAIDDCAARAPSFYGDPDILVQAAGVNIRKPMLDITEEDWDQSLKLNLDALFFLAQKLAPAMIAKRWGRIINIASMQSIRAFGNSGPYGASKGAVIQLTRAQAEAWSKFGVNTNAIGPGFFATPLTIPVTSDPVRWKAMADKTFIGRNGELDDLRGAAIFLASRASDFVTGQTLFVDGGFSAG